MSTQTSRQLSSNVQNDFTNNFISKNKCLCENIDYQYVYKNPREYEDIYVELYRQILYNLSLLKTLTYVTNGFMGKIRKSDKLIILKIIKAVRNSIESFCKTEINYSIYGDDKIFYACLPYYNDFNELSYIKISKGISFYNIRDTCNSLIDVISFYLLY
jgi:hypothetical protein